MKAVYCVGTHWDREWYKPFQEFRMWLVELIDELMDLMERDPNYVSFHLDGQTVVLEDYLEIRPERRERLLALLKERRLLVGPWYNLPDEWLISGESYVRNLMRGMRICRTLGVPHLDFAYTPDQFGHIAALPMIMHGFGLSAGICWRGTQDEHYPGDFTWVGPDGSRLAYHKLIDKGSYGPFDFAVRTPLKCEGCSDENFAKYFEPYLKEERERSSVDTVLMLDAIDHQRPDPGMPALLEELRRRYPDIEFVWSSLEDYGRELARHVDTLPERHGELRQPVRDAHRVGQYLIVHTLSSRYPLKRRNGQCQALLEKWAEPYALFQRMAGGAPVPGFLDKAWQYLLRNHPHDSICGCSVDQVHRDMHYRFDQAEMLGDGVTRRAMAFLGKASDAGEAWENVVVHNPLPFPRRGVFDLALEFPVDYPKKYIDGLATGQQINKFHLVNADGTRLDWQFRAIERNQPMRRINDLGRVPLAAAVDCCHVAVELDLPPCGYTSFRVEPTDDGTRNFGSLLTGPMSASNGLFEASVHTDGTVTLRHEATGRAFTGCFTYEDCGDCGDGWTRGQLVNDVVYRGPGQCVATAIEEDGPLRTVFRIEREFRLPRTMELPAYARSADRVTVRVTDFLCIEKGAAALRVRTIIDNTARDHRFRVLFPTAIASDCSFAETPFALVERPIAIPEESRHWQERINPESAFSSHFGIQDTHGGLALLSPWGLHEYEVSQTPEHSLVLTLFRATQQTVGTAGEPEGQLLEELVFDYQLWPFAGAFDAAEAGRLTAAQQAGVRMHFADKAPAKHSFLRLEPGHALVTALKPAEDVDGGIVRLWNPTDQPLTERLFLDVPVKEAARCNLNEEPLEPIPVTAGQGISIEVPARGLATIRVLF